jgi:hypothetical protein
MAPSEDLPMQRAEKVFHIEERVPESAFADTIWRARSGLPGAFISVAATRWEIVIWQHAGVTHATLRGPETRASAMPIPADAEFFGVRFKLGVFMPGIDLPGLADRSVALASGGATLSLGSADREIPTYENVEIFLEQLARESVIAVDPIVAQAMDGQPIGVSRRSLERRVRRATGLPLGAIKRIERARKAAALLDAGTSIPDVVIETGYADQAHLTRSLKRFMGETPGSISQAAR